MEPCSGSESPQRKRFAGLFDHLTSLPFIGVHLACALAFWVGFSWEALAFCLGAYYLRMFAITAGYHRYFSHRSFKTSRVFQFILAFLGGASVQKGALWWAGHHRFHHRYSDTEQDIHSPLQRGFFWSHVGWFLAHDYDATDWDRIRDFAKYPELRFLNRFHLIPGFCMAAAVYFAFGFQIFVWTFFVSTVLLWHGTFTINSLCHVFGKRVYKTSDTSRNSFILSLVTMGEGWHNNHHYYQASVNQGWHWWQIDITFYILLGLEKLGIVWDLKHPPKAVVAGFKSGRDDRVSPRQGLAAA